MSDDQDFLDAIDRFGQAFLEKYPRFDDLIQTARAGLLDPKEVIKEVWKAAASDRDFQMDVDQAVRQAFQLDPTGTDLVKFPERQKMLDRWGFSDEDLIFQPFEDRPDYQMLHPLLMGMIVERLQFDGDVPELRTGPLPEGGSPAVPVQTMARSPVVIGAMLRTASNEVALELGVAKEEKDAKVARMIAVLPEEDGGALVRQESERALSVPGYVPGQKIGLRKVEAPTGAALAQMSFEEKQELAHKALTSRQGRRSAMPVIAELVRDALAPQLEKGITIKAQSSGTLFAKVTWGMQIDGGTTERNPRFNFIDTAARSLANKLLRELNDQTAWDKDYELVIATIDTVEKRWVGWGAVLYS